MDFWPFSCFPKITKSLKGYEEEKVSSSFLRGAKLPCFHTVSEIFTTTVFGGCLSSFFIVTPFSCPDFVQQVEVKWPCDNDEVASFPLQMINSDKGNCTAGRGMLGYQKDQSFRTCHNIFLLVKKGTKKDTGPMSSLARLLFPVVKIGSCDTGS